MDTTGLCEQRRNIPHETCRNSEEGLFGRGRCSPDKWGFQKPLKWSFLESLVTPCEGSKRTQGNGDAYLGNISEFPNSLLSGIYIFISVPLLGPYDKFFTSCLEAPFSEPLAGGRSRVEAQRKDVFISFVWFWIIWRNKDAAARNTGVCWFLHWTCFDKHDW